MWTFQYYLEDSLQPTGYGYDTAYIILDSSDTGFVDEHGKVDLESGVLFGELDGLLLEPAKIEIGNATFTTGVILADTDGTNSTIGALTFETSFETVDLCRNNQIKLIFHSDRTSWYRVCITRRCICYTQVIMYYLKIYL